MKSGAAKIRAVRILAALALALSLAPLKAKALQMDPVPFENFSQDDFSFSLYRYEKPSFYLANSGLPDFFFNDVSKLSEPTPASPGADLIYSLRSIQYGLQVSAWPTNELQIRVSLPFETNAFEDLGGVTQNRQNIGDLEVGATYLLTGKRTGGNYFGVDGWYRFATGTSPFNEAVSPILATGKGAPEGSLGVILRQQLARFSLFESVHYQHSQPLQLTSSSLYLGPGVFQWPDEFQALIRAEFMAFQQAERMVTLFGQYRMRKIGVMTWNQTPLTYNQGRYADQLFYLGGGMTVRVDAQLTVDAEVDYFPSEIGGAARAGYGNLFFLSVSYRPFDL